MQEWIHVHVRQMQMHVQIRMQQVMVRSLHVYGPGWGESGAAESTPFGGTVAVPLDRKLSGWARYATG